MSMIIRDYKFRKGFRSEVETKFAAIFPAWKNHLVCRVFYPVAP